MAEHLICSVPGCGRRFPSGRGGIGGKKPKCPMHYQRERRKSPNALEPGPVLAKDGDPRNATLMVHLTPGLKSWVVAKARAAAMSASRFVERLLQSERSE